MIQEAYNKLAKKHQLPKYDELNNELEISTAEHEEFLIREIRRKILERVDFLAETLNNLLQPDTASIPSMTEHNSFDEKELEETTALFKKIMILKRKGERAAFSEDEEEATYVKEAFETLKTEKQNIKKAFERMKEAWNKEEKGYSGAEYLG